MPSRRSRREKNHAKMTAKLSVDELHDAAPKNCFVEAGEKGTLRASIN